MRAIEWGTRTLLVLAAAGTLGLLAHAGKRPEGVGDLLVVGAFAAWAVSPYVMLAGLGFAVRRSLGATIAAALGALLVMCYGAVSLGGPFVRRPDAQDALLFVFVPLYQWGGCLVTTLVALVMSAAGRREPANG